MSTYSDNAIAYTSFHFFVQGKKNIVERLRYIHDLYEIPGGFDALIREYEDKAYQKLMKMAALNLKYNVMEKKTSNTFNDNPVFIKKLTDGLREAKEAEKDILFEVYRQLLDYRRENFCNGNYYGGEYDKFTYEYPDLHSVKVILGEPQYITDIKILTPDNRILVGSFELSNGRKFFVCEGDISLAEKIHDIYAEKIYEFIYTTEDPNIDIQNIKFKMMVGMGNSYWDFTGVDRYINYKWQINKEMSIEDKGYKIMGKDPTLTCDNICIDLNKSKYIYIKYNTSCLSESAQLFFSTYDYLAISEEQSKVFTISPNDRLFEYILDMSNIEKWAGAADKFRFDPVSYDNTSKEGECIMEYIEISDRLPVYGSEKDYMKTQGVNGWSYHTYNNATTYHEMVWDDQKGVWTAKSDEELTISSHTQTSKNHMGAARRWTCPAEGNYTVKYNFNQIAENGRPGRERLTHLVLRRNHKIMEKDIYDRDSGTLAGNHEIEMSLETGEVLGFEFYNGSEHTTETLEIDIAIEKQSS